ncbi:hypothetical protein EYC84_010757 [Monilinia fructicola]|uniref:Uncharacterized protein n=1 Tax=Monilinia fructicola TaxID=38448 RepID=A0A5M9J676_MONFR|nr:hypothetical protein EYC84_010757 [Monilinia fructicola]
MIILIDDEDDEDDQDDEDDEDADNDNNDDDEMQMQMKWNHFVLGVPEWIIRMNEVLNQDLTKGSRERSNIPRMEDNQ